MIITKIGPHGIETTQAGLDWSRVAPIVKQVDRINLLQVAPDHAIRIYRQYFKDQNLNNLSPVDAVNQIVAGLNGYRHPRLYVELLNECYPRLGSGLEEYCEWTREATNLLHLVDLKVAGFGFATGNPEPDVWAYLLTKNYGNVDALSIHEYWGMSGFSGWNALRYRKVHEWTGGNHPPFIITECGRDNVEGAGRGWRKDGISKQQYINELLAYNAQLNLDDYVIGAVVFTAGPTPDWEDFSTDIITADLLPQLPEVKPLVVKERSMLKTTDVFPGLTVYDVRDQFPYYANQKYQTRDLRSITHYVQHHAAGGMSVPMTTDQAMAALKSIHDWHTWQKWGWPAIGYHFGIDGEGRIYWLNSLDLISYHARAANDYGIGVVWLGDFENSPPHTKMIEASIKLWRSLTTMLGLAQILVGHREVPTNSTTCPGNHWAGTKKMMLGIQTPPVVSNPTPIPAPIHGFEITGTNTWKCTLTGADLSWRMLEFYLKYDGLRMLGYPRTNGWRTIEGKLSKVFQRGIVEIKSQYITSGAVNPTTSADDLFELRLLGDEWLKSKGEL